MIRFVAPLAVVLVLAGCGTTTSPDIEVISPDEVAARAAHSATVLADGSVLIAGGCVVNGCTTASADAFVLVGNQATRVGPLAMARDAHTATTLASGDVLVTGGFTAEGTPPLASAEVFDADAGVWISVDGLSVGRGGHAAAMLGDGRVAVAGGWLRSGTYTAGIELFDPVTERFTAGPDLPVAADGLDAVKLADGRVLVTGGQSSPGVATDQAVVLSADGMSLEVVGPLLTARFKHTMVALDDGRVLVIGGTSDDTEILTSTELFDPSTGAFTPGPTLLHGRYKLAGGAALLPDGRVVVGGGGTGVELIDVQSGTSVEVSIASGVSSFSTISVTRDAAVLLGGYDEGITLTRRYVTIPLTELAALA